MADVFCINCKYILINRKKGVTGYDCTAVKDTVVVPGDAVFPPVETKNYADPYVKNINNDCSDYKDKKDK